MNSSDLKRLAEVRSLASSGAARSIRRGADITLAEIADACGVGLSTVWRWENGERTPRGRPALRYAEVLYSLMRVRR